MNGNYEWNKQYSRQRAQDRYREASLYRQAKQQNIAKPSHGYFRGWLASLLTLLHKASDVNWAIVTRQVRQNWLQ